MRVNTAFVSAHGVKDEEEMLGRDDRAFHPPALAGLSSTHFNRRFQQPLRMTPTAYLRTVRIQAARRLLSTTNRDVSDIAHETGFTDQSHFTRCFREPTSLTPGDYRGRIFH